MIRIFIASLLLCSCEKPQEPVYYRTTVIENEDGSTMTITQTSNQKLPH